MVVSLLSTEKYKSYYSKFRFIKFLVIMISILSLASLGSARYQNSQEENIYWVTNNQDEGPGSFRQALIDAGQGVTIRFSREVFKPSDPATIKVSSCYPPLDDGYVTIDASDTGVILDGRELPRGSAIPGLSIQSNGNTIMGIHILNFPASGIGISNGAKNNLIGGSGKREGNVVGGNLDGILIVGSNTMNNIVIGNYLGIDENNSSIGNHAAGIWIGDGASKNIIGGRIHIESNTISANDAGIILQDTRGNQISGNLIGTDKFGKESMGNNGPGIGINMDAHDNVIGGLDADNRNIISGNNGDGIYFFNSAIVTGNKIIGNYIGTDISGKLPLGNKDSGIRISEGATKNEIGPNNVIAFNEKIGIVVEGSLTTGNLVTQNHIYSNQNIGVLNRDGGNKELPAPEITLIDSRSIQGYALPNLKVEIYSDKEDEAEFFEGSSISDSMGFFSFSLSSGSFQEQFITTIAIDNEGNTSQLSQPKENPGYGILKELPNIISPSQVSRDKAVIGTNFVFAILSTLYFGFTSSVFSNILKNYNKEINQSISKLFSKMIHKYTNIAMTPKSAKLGQNSIRLIGLLISFTFFSALVESFLDTQIGIFEFRRMNLVLNLFLAGLLISGIELLMDKWLHKKFLNLVQVTSSIQWAGLFFSILSVIISRLLHFTPGFIYGMIGAIYLSPPIYDRIKSGKRVLLIQSVIFSSGIFLWGLSALLPTFLNKLEPLLLTLFLIALERVFFELIPIQPFDGIDLWNWKKGLWFTVYLIVFFCFYHFLLNPNAASLQSLQQTGIKILIIAALIFGQITLTLWFLFPFRLRKR